METIHIVDHTSEKSPTFFQGVSCVTPRGRNVDDDMSTIKYGTHIIYMMGRKENKISITGRSHGFNKRRHIV